MYIRVFDIAISGTGKEDTGAIFFATVLDRTLKSCCSHSSCCLRNYHSCTCHWI